MGTWVRLLGDTHPSVVHTRNSLALLAADLGDYASAEASYREILPATVQQLGADHPATHMIRPNPPAPLPRPCPSHAPATPTRSPLHAHATPPFQHPPAVPPANSSVTPSRGFGACLLRRHVVLTAALVWGIRAWFARVWHRTAGIHCPERI